MSIPSSRLRRGDEARDPPRLEVLLDLHALLARERAVMRARKLFLGELVEPRARAARRAAVVDEDDRRAVLRDELEQRRVDRGPDRAGSTRARRQHAPSLDGLRRRCPPGSRMSSTGTTTSRSSSLRVPASTSWIGRSPETKRPISSSGRCVAERPMRCAGRASRRVEPLERERQVRAALGARDGVHLVDDHRLERAQHLARLRGQHQEERLGRRDQDVGRRLDAARAAPSAGVSPVRTATRSSELEAGERAAQVALDVVVERLQRRDVEQPQALAGVAVELVDPVQERGERLAGAGRRLDQTLPPVAIAGQPATCAGVGPGERALEPVPRLRRERRERIHAIPSGGYSSSSSAFETAKSRNWVNAVGEKLLSLTRIEGATAVGQLLPERHPFDVVERDPEHVEIEQQLLLGRAHARRATWRGCRSR